MHTFFFSFLESHDDCNDDKVDVNIHSWSNQTLPGRPASLTRLTTSPFGPCSCHNNTFFL